MIAFNVQGAHNIEMSSSSFPKPSVMPWFLTFFARNSKTFDAAGNLVKETAPDGTTQYTYNAQNRLILGEKDNGESSAYTYNALGVRIENVQVRANENRGYANAPLSNGSRYIKDYTKAFSDNRATWQRSWETEIGTVVQNDFETVTRHYISDYLSVANRDILVIEDESFVVRYIYDESGKRLSAGFDYADGTARGVQNASGEYGENPASDIAVGDIGKVWYRTSLLNSTLYAADKDGETVVHMIYDAWGNPLIETYADANFSGLENLNNFTGYTWDKTLGLYFAQNRFYDPTTHRFTQEDIIKDGSNWYVYCANSPVVYVDWDGHAYDVCIKQAVPPYRPLAYGVLTDIRYASDGFFSIREVAAVLDQISGYSVKVDYDKQTNAVTLNVKTPSSYKRLKVSINDMARGYFQKGNMVCDTGVYFTYYQCPINPRTYIHIGQLAEFLGLSIEVREQPRNKDGYRFVGFGIQLEFSISIGISGGELVFFTDSKVSNGRPWYQPNLYIYGGGGPSADIKSLIARLTENPSLLLGNSPASLGGGSACVFAIFGNDHFNSPADYRGLFGSVSVTIDHKKGYVAWSDKAVVTGIGFSTKAYEASSGFTEYDLVGDGEFLDGYKLALQARQIAETIEMPE